MLIRQSDYHRIYKIINSLLIAQNADPSTAAMYFSTFGAFILKQHYKVNAVPRSGLAAYNFDGKLFLFADHREDGYVTGAGDNFHCWVEADGWAIDFMAPAFADNTRQMPVPARMMQRPLADMAKSINELERGGDFFYRSEPEASAHRFADWHKQAAIGDLASIAAKWFRKSPKQIANSITVQNQDGMVRTVPLAGNALTGAW